MFTGLVEDVGQIARAERRGETLELEIQPAVIPCGEFALGDSVAIDGVCLTVVWQDGKRFRVQAGPETLALTTIGQARAGGAVNLERAVLPTTRLGGHMVTGHVDGIGEVAQRRPVGTTVDFVFRTPREFLRYVVHKGAIAVDGISLTVNRVDEYSFAVGLIPHTIDKTSLAGKHPGAKVNLEVDIMGKYVEQLVKAHLEGRR